MDNKHLDIDECVENYFHNLKQFKPLKKEEERKLIEAYKLRNDINARNKLIEHNLKYACQLANGYRNKGLSFSDLISEANSGLIDAIEKYDIKQDVKLISYSKWWIIQRMQAALERENKLPREALEIESNEESLFEDDMYENNSCYDYEDSDFDYNEISNNKYLIEKITSQINEREKDIVYRYYGINQNERYTLEEIGKEYGLTKERVRQIIDKAMTKMRSEALLIDNSYL
jgi:RNA polymerase primary sigma factor